MDEKANQNTSIGWSIEEAADLAKTITANFEELAG